MTAISKKFTVKGWSAGMITRLDPWVIPSDALTVAQGVNLRNGRIQPRIDLGDADVDASGYAPYVWLHRFEEYYDSGTTAVVQGQRWVVSDKLTYSNPISVAIPTEDAKIDGQFILVLDDAVTPSVPVIYVPTDDPGTPLVVDPGLLPPAPIASLSTAGGTITDPAAYWMHTEVDFLDNESPPSVLYGPQALTAEKATLGVDPPVNALIESFRFYRLVHGRFVFVGESVGDVSAGYSFDDDVGVVPSSAEVLATIGKVAAPLLLGMAFGTYDGRWGGFNGSKFYMSEPGKPGDWRQPFEGLDAPIVAAIGTDIGWLVLHGDSVSLVHGSGDVVTSVKHYSRYGCLVGAAFSAARTNVGWVWRTKDGIVAWNGQAFSLLTLVNFSDEQLALISPTGLKAAFVDGEYRLFHDCGCLHVDLRSGTPVPTTSCTTADALFQDRRGVLYVADNDANTVKPWNGTTFQMAVVRFGEIVAPDDGDRHHVHGAQIRFDGGALSAQWYQADVAHGPALAVPANGMLWCPRGAWDRISLELWGDATVHSVTFNPFS